MLQFSIRFLHVFLQNLRSGYIGMLEIHDH